MEVQEPVQGDPTVAAPAPSLLRSNLENLLTEDATRNAPAGDDNDSPMSPSKSKFGNILKKRKRVVSNPRSRTPASEVLRRAFTAGHGFMEPAGGIPPVNPAPPAVGAQPLGSAQQDRDEPLGYTIVRKFRRLIGWGSQRAEPAGLEPEPMNIDEPLSPQSYATLTIGAPSTTSASLPTVPQNSPARSEYQQLSPREGNQQQKMPALQNLDTGIAAIAGANSGTLKSQSPKPGIGQRIKERVGAMNRFITRESGRWLHFRTLPYVGNLGGEEEAQSPVEIEMDHATAEGYDGDNEGQGDSSSGFSAPSMTTASAVMPPLRSQHRSSSLSQPTVERIDEASKEGSSALSGSQSAAPISSGEEGDDESASKLKKKKANQV